MCAERDACRLRSSTIVERFWAAWEMLVCVAAGQSVVDCGGRGVADPPVFKAEDVLLLLLLALLALVLV